MRRYKEQISLFLFCFLALSLASQSVRAEDLDESLGNAAQSGFAQLLGEQVDVSPDTAGEMQAGFASLLQKTPQPETVVQEEVVLAPVTEKLEIAEVEVSAEVKSEPAQDVTEAVAPKVEAQIDPIVDTSLGVQSEPPIGVSNTSLAGFFGQAGTPIPLELGGRQELVADIAAPLTVASAVVLALRNNFEVRAASASLDSARWDKWGAYSQYLPTVEYSAARGRERSRPASYNDGDGNRVLDSGHFRTDRSFSIRQPLFDPSIIADILKFHSNEDLTYTQQLDVNEDIALKTVNTFFQLLQARKTVQLLNQYKGYLGKLHERMKARVEGGAGIRSDVDRIYSRLMLAEAQRLEALGSYSTRLGEFRRLTRVTPAMLTVPETFIPKTPSSAGEALSLALKKNPGYLISLDKIEVAKADREQSFSGLLPKLSVEYSRINTYNAGGVAAGNTIDGVYPKQDDERLMLVASWSLSGGTSVTSGLSGHAKVRQMMMLSRDVRARVEAAIETGYDALDAAAKRIVILQDTYNVDKRIASDFEEQYKQGNRSLFELLDAYERLHASQIALMQTIIAKAEVAYQIKRQTGNLTRSLVGSEGI